MVRALPDEQTRSLKEHIARFSFREGGVDEHGDGHQAQAASPHPGSIAEPVDALRRKAGGVAFGATCGGGE